MALYWSLFLYLPSGPRAEAKVEVKAQETAGVGLEVSLQLVRAPPAL